MTEETLSRRALLRCSVHLALIGSIPAILKGCSKGTLECTDLDGLAQGDKQLRAAQEYKDISPFGNEKNCKSCEFFKAGGADECGTCTIVKGPINPAGYCSSWVKRQI